MPRQKKTNATVAKKDNETANILQKRKEKDKLPDMAAGPGEVQRKIEKDELISLQREGKLIKYDPRTRIGVVKSQGCKVKWPVDPEKVKNDVL